MDLEHKVLDENEEFLICFTNSCWYDTATPAQWCANRLIELKDKIKNGQKLKIESNGVYIEIQNLTDFKIWLKDYFNGGFENMFDDE
jgi:hypothetical protein